MIVDITHSRPQAHLPTKFSPEKPISTKLQVFQDPEIRPGIKVQL